MALYITFPSWIKPEIFSFLPIRWYGLMYILAFGCAYYFITLQAKHDEITLSKDQSLDIVMWCVIGLILGARLFSVLFYDGTTYYLTHPHLIFWPFRNGQFVGLPGMSYHGGLFGAAVSAIIYTRKRKIPFFEVADTVVYSVPLGYTFGRLGNFINGELYGRVSTKPWAMIFPDAPAYSTNYEWVRQIADQLHIPYEVGQYINLPRHPSQLYEALFEGIFLFFFLWFVIKPKRKEKPFGTGLSWYLIGYGTVRFFIEYLRSPDANLGYILSWGAGSDNIALFYSFLNISMGQIFCLIMIAFGGALRLIIHIRSNR
ncbi:MAG: prolipoprotein diacylglyceryl transferase [Sphaerochaeta sp.]